MFWDTCSYNIDLTVAWAYTGLLIRYDANRVAPAMRILEENTE